MSQSDSRPVEGSIWERNDELFIVERVYGAQKSSPPGITGPAFVPITLVKIRCIDPMPGHVELPNFLQHYHPYNPFDDDEMSDAEYDESHGHA